MSPSQPLVFVVINSLQQGGAEESLRAMLPLVRAEGPEVEVLLLESSAPAREDALRRAGVPVQVIGPAAGPLAVARRLRPIIRARRPDLLHLTLFDPIVGGAVAALGTGVPVIATMANTVPNLDRSAPSDSAGRRWKLRAARSVEGFACRRLVTSVHAVTAGVATDAIAAFRLRPAKVRVLHRGRSAERFHPPSPEERRAHRAHRGIGDEALVAVTLGRHEPSKGLLDLVDTAARLRSRLPDLHVYQAGRSGSVSGELRRRISAAGLDGRFHLLGDIDDPESLLAAADLFVLPSLREGTSGATLEAMATGLPVVATDLDGMRGILVDGRNALVVPPADPAAFAAAIERVATDGELARSLGRAALETFRADFELTGASSALAGYYRSVASQGTGRRGRRRGGYPPERPASAR